MKKKKNKLCDILNVNNNINVVDFYTFKRHLELFCNKVLSTKEEYFFRIRKSNKYFAIVPMKLLIELGQHRRKEMYEKIAKDILDGVREDNEKILKQFKCQDIIRENVNTYYNNNRDYNDLYYLVNSPLAKAKGLSLHSNQ